MSEKDTFEYPGAAASVSWNGKLCIHIGECGRASGDLFVGGRKPWCQPDMSSNDEVVDVVLRCPTGALSVEFSDGSYKEKTQKAIRDFRTRKEARRDFLLNKIDQIRSVPS